MPLIQYISRIQFDYGALGLLPDELTALGLKRPLLVTDPGIGQAGILDRVLDAVRPLKPVVFDQTPENPNEGALDQCMALWHEQGCDGLIALGGGSPIDLSKAVALISSHGGTLSDYDVKTGGSANIGKVSPQIAIPTAAGTGAEVGRACVMLDRSGKKVVAVNLNMVAETVICDPELTLSLPRLLTAATGIDALSHGMETTCSPWINPPARAMALDCVQRASRWLPRAVENGANREARWEMMMASLMGGLCLQKALGGAHALANPLGELGVHHGTLIGVLLPHVLAFNEGHADEAFEDLRAVIGLEGSVSLARWTADLVGGLGLPARLSEMGIEATVLNDMASKAAKDHLSATNPRPANEADYLALLNAAF